MTIINEKLLFIIFTFIISFIAYTEYKMKNTNFLTIACFLTGLFQVLMLFITFYFIFSTINNEAIQLNSSKILSIFIYDYIGFNIFVIILYIYYLSIKTRINFKVLVNYSHLFLPLLILSIALLFLIKLDNPLNYTVYRRIIFMFLEITVFKIIYITAHLLFINIKLSDN